MIILNDRPLTKSEKEEMDTIYTGCWCKELPQKWILEKRIKNFLDNSFPEGSLEVEQ